MFTAILAGEGKGYTIKEIKFAVEKTTNTGDEAYVDDGDRGMVVALDGDMKVRFWKL